MKIVQIVRKFGLVGGMESYVFHLSRALISKGVDVEIVCESVETPPDFQVHLSLVPASNEPRRWKAMREFRSRTERLVQKKRERGHIIHSHERSTNHHVTTFHGPPMPSFKTLPLYKKISPRVRAWCLWEREEVCSPSVTAVVPVSNLIGKLIAETHPCSKRNLCAPGYPGLETNKPLSFRPQSSPVKLLFVGREWKRKGLVFAVEILKQLPLATLDVYGVNQETLPTALLEDRVRIRGWAQDVPYWDYDILIHPASIEPFGMVIPEALVNGCRVLASSSVGAAELDHPGLECLDLQDGVMIWIEALKRLCAQNPKPYQNHWTWDALADYYLEQIYPYSGAKRS